MKKVVSVLIACFMLFGVFSPSLVYADEERVFVKYNSLSEAEEYITVEELDPDDRGIRPAYMPDLMSDNYVVGEDSPRSIIGEDERISLTESQASTFPYSAIVLILSGYDTNNDGIADKFYRGSGAFVGPKTISTAGHCLWSDDYGWPKVCRIYTCISRVSLTGVSYISAYDYFVPSNYITNSTTRDQYDWGLIDVPDNCNITDTIGYLGYSTSTSLVGKSFCLSGYPSDRDYYQVISYGTVSSETSNLINYNMDTYKGHSGSPIFSESSAIMWAIHTTGVTSYNYGSRVNSLVYDTITSHRDNHQDATSFVYRLYKEALGRDPDVNGINSWVSLLRNHLTGGKTVSNNIFFSQEFINLNLGNTAFVTRLYKAMLNRNPDSAGLSSWVSYLSSGGSRQTVFNGFAESTEFYNICALCNIDH